MTEWRKSSRSNASGGSCVEVHRLLSAVRDSKNTTGPTLSANVAALVTDVKSGRIT